MRIQTKAEVEEVVRAHLANFAQGDFDAWGARLAPDVFMMAADPDEVFARNAVARFGKIAPSTHL